MGLGEKTPRSGDRRKYIAQSGVYISTAREYIAESGVYIFNRKGVYIAESGVYIWQFITVAQRNGNCFLFCNGMANSPPVLTRVYRRATASTIEPCTQY